jgi:hypothetical protein
MIYPFAKRVQCIVHIDKDIYTGGRTGGLKCAYASQPFS